MWLGTAACALVQGAAIIHKPPYTVCSVARSVARRWSDLLGIGKECRISRKPVEPTRIPGPRTPVFPPRARRGRGAGGEPPCPTGGDSTCPNAKTPAIPAFCSHTRASSVTFSSTFCACSKPANPLPRSCNEPCPFEIGKRSRDYRPRGRRVIVATIRGIQPRLADSEQRPCARLSRAVTRSSTHKHVHSPRTEGTSAAHQGPYIAQSTIEIIVVIILTAWVE